MAAAVCPTTVACLQSFQPMIAATIAATAATISALVIWRAARLTDCRERHYKDEELERRRRHTAVVLGGSVQSIAGRKARAVQGTVKVMSVGDYAFDERSAAAARIELTKVAEQWEAVSLLPAQLQRDLVGLQNLLETHNERMCPGATFLEGNFREDVMHRLDLVTKQANALVGPLMLVARGVQ